MGMETKDYYKIVGAANKAVEIVVMYHELIGMDSEQHYISYIDIEAHTYFVEYYNKSEREWCGHHISIDAHTDAGFKEIYDKFKNLGESERARDKQIMEANLTSIEEAEYKKYLELHDKFKDKLNDKKD